MVFTNRLRLGETLKQAGLINDRQVQTALADRQQTKHLRVGEIMAIRGWIDRQTANFFAEEWHSLISQINKEPIGYYLKRAGLLTDSQTKLILEEQKQIWVKFGSVAVLQGLVKQKTIDFFLDNLFPLEALDSPLIGKKEEHVEKKVISVREIERKEESEAQKIDYDDIPWID